MIYEPLLEAAIWLGVTLLAYRMALWLYQKAGGTPLLHPLLVTSLIVAFALFLSSVDIPAYQHHAQLLHWLLGPATVALAVPLYRQLHQIREHHLRTLLPVIVGGAAAPLICVCLLMLFDTDSKVILSSWSKSITTPLAMETSEILGGLPGLAAVLVIITGVIGAIFANLIFKWGKIDDDISKGVALGTAAHAVGTAHGFQLSEKTGAFSSMALCINGILTALILPVLFRFFS